MFPGELACSAPVNQPTQTLVSAEAPALPSVSASPSPQGRLVQAFVSVDTGSQFMLEETCGVSGQAPLEAGVTTSGHQEPSPASAWRCRGHAGPPLQPVSTPKVQSFA